MQEPICLIENKPNEKLYVNQKALELLQAIQQPVVVVAIVGLYRTGKSYLMNKLAGKNKGFSLGATIQANTMGIWMWCLPHPKKHDHTLVLLDTEGLGDVEKSNTENDAWIFALSVLLSSTLVYNSMGTIDQTALEKLQYVTELTKCIKVKAIPPGCSKKETSGDFLRFFPAFIWTVRDFSLELELNGCPISADEYLENALQRKKDSPEKLDLAKKCIRQYFPSRKCFVLDRPTSRRELKNLENLSESKLNSDFVEELHSFLQYIYEKSKAKVIQGGHVVTGTMLGNLAVTYVDSIRSGTVPCIENAVLALAQIENSAAVQEAIKHYEDTRVQLLKLPTETVEELLTAHSKCEREAIQVFMTRAFNDEGQKYQRQLAMTLESMLQDLCSRNEQASLDRCQAVLKQLFQDMEEKTGDGTYSVPGGYQQFLNDQKEKLEQYQQVPGKGFMASKALQDYLKSKEAVAQSILNADRNLTDREKEAEVERVRAQAATQEAELHRKMKEEAIQMAKEKEESYEEHKRQLMAKMETDRKNQQLEHERMLNAKLQEERRLHEEGLRSEATRMQSEIQQLKQQLQDSQSRHDPCVIL
ncbi:guanylate-binding protein 1-like [Eublepharis macularius]|uniref:Guanylate-binding protein 1-like n=1 Tax=Eublepharis macularius TaxID=481883 RepID=A0AA97LHI1_EUBMA|nr:guanylate-binding protein 1-like [Eublepharis macularius]XP_054855604.1 guanylate-binding protein 1-like [Eublepharis macularius]